MSALECVRKINYRTDGRFQALRAVSGENAPKARVEQKRRNDLPRLQCLREHVN